MTTQDLSTQDLSTRKRQTLSVQKRICLGGLGALTPIVINLLTVDLEQVFSHFTWFAAMGYGIRTVILFYFGGIMAYLHKDEMSPVKLFELGIVAPALITAFLNGQVSMSTQREDAPVMTPRGEEVGWFLSPAYAQPVSTQGAKTLPKIRPPQQTRLQELWRGLTGTSSRRLWFVIAGSHLVRKDAEKQARMLNKTIPGLHAQVYEPYGNSEHYPVVLGTHLTQDEALRLRRKAIVAGLPRDIYIWRIPPRNLQDASPDLPPVSDSKRKGAVESRAVKRPMGDCGRKQSEHKRGKKRDQEGQEDRFLKRGDRLSGSVLQKCRPRAGRQ